MAANNIKFHVLDVGQGTGNFIETYSSTKVLTKTILIDLGSERAKKTAGVPSAKFVADQLKNMTGGAVLDTLIMSHSDSDHINLLPDLLEYFDPPGIPSIPPKPTLTIKVAYYGGNYN